MYISYSCAERYKDRYIRTGRFITYTSRCKDASGFILFIDANEISRQTFRVKYVSSRLFLATASFGFIVISFHPFLHPFSFPLFLSVPCISREENNIKRYKVEFTLSLIISHILRCYSHDPAVTVHKCYFLRYCSLFLSHEPTVFFFSVCMCASSLGTFVLHEVSINCAFPPPRPIYITRNEDLAKKRRGKKTKR